MNDPAQPDPRYAQSRRAFARARELMPGGVSSPVRAFKAVGREPITIRRGKGARVTDLDGNHYIDYVLSYGPLILGHAPDRVQAAISKAVTHGMSFGMPTEGESALAELIISAMPSIELVRFVNSGTEATMSAIRLARAATGRAKVIKCTGCYHGHSDSLLVQAGSGAMTLGVPSSPGVPASITANTLLAPYNDLAAMERLLAEVGKDVACILIEPIAGNMGCVPPKAGYLEGLRKLCDTHGVLLIFDEVMTGFRVGWGGAQSLYKIRPDLTCLGKVIGGGVPCAAYGGRKDLMRQISPDGPVYQAGTLSGNPLAMAAGIATLEGLRDGKAYEVLERSGAMLETGLKAAAARAGVPIHCTRVGSMFCPFFTSGPVENHEQALVCDTKAYARFFGVMLDEGVTLPPSQFETWFLSTEHDDGCIEQTLVAADKAFAVVAKHS